MSKEQLSLGFRIKHLFTYHPWLKLISLAAAVVVWFYVKAKLI